ncbi:MAG: hypothetical protein ACLUGJ_15350 [Blautia wexlerae]
MAVRTQPDALKVFAAIAMIVNSREDSAKVKLTSVARKTEKEEKEVHEMKKPSELLAGFRRRFVDVQVNTHLGIIVLRTA